MSNVERLSQIENALKDVNFNDITVGGIYRIIRSRNIPINLFEIMLIGKIAKIVGKRDEEK